MISLAAWITVSTSALSKLSTTKRPRCAAGTSGAVGGAGGNRGGGSTRGGGSSGAWARGPMEAGGSGGSGAGAGGGGGGTRRARGGGTGGGGGGRGGADPARSGDAQTRAGWRGSGIVRRRRAAGWPAGVWG